MSEQVPVTDAHDRLGAAMRTLADVVARTGAGEADLDAAAAVLAELTERLAEPDLHRRVHDSPYHAMSLVGGSSHPLAPQLHTEPTGNGGVSGVVALGPTFEGGPGLVHGGVLSLLFDHAMGQAIYHAGHPAMTVSLEVRYLAPTPLYAPLTVQAHVERIDGRKIYVTGEISADGTVTATATGLFVALTRSNVAAIFPADRLPTSSHIRPHRA
jgi:acyl-coenzyme A thioesterase PaaI-like protein